MHTTTSDDAGAAKASLRAVLRARRRALNPEQRASARAGWAAGAEEIAGLARQAHAADGPATIASYLPAPSEPDPTAAMEAWHAAGLRVLVPLSLPGRRLAWVRWLPGIAVRTGEHAPVPEPVGAEAADPTGISLAVVPALAVGADGTRLGQGGGYYDSFLQGRGIPGYACVFSDEVLECVPAQPWDARLRGAWTPDAVRSLPLT
ncbi:MAG: 5-formyltetrahydrofolate cyclo-ligase [Arthrobacter sp.]|jgi:5-formyltetrahydrofolate cyclo-ligase|nr:5-formyltetrahydrofolate cyclo-ligase [Arthrobacter sp.]